MALMPKSTHFLWALYLALAAEGGRSKPEGRAAIKALLPSYAPVVDEIVGAMGDVSKLKPEVMQTHTERMEQEARHIGNHAMNAKIREPKSSGQATLTGTGSDMNEQIRAFRTGSRISIEG
jgi:hypothetical protein